MTPNSPSSQHAAGTGLPTLSSRRRYFVYFAVAVFVLLFGALRLPIETRLASEQRGGTNSVSVDLSLRAKLGQLGFLAALSGFRTLVADLLWIQANTDWQRVEYGPMNLLFNTVTTLTPHNINFWDESSWHMAYNASVAAMDDRKQPSIARRKKAQHEYFMIGVDFLKRGIANNPRSYLLHQSLGIIYRDKLNDYCDASAEFDKAAVLPGVPTYTKRFAAYALSQCPGHERQAWERLRKLYDLGPQERLPTLEKDLKAMEDALNLPDDQRIFKAPPTDLVKDLEGKLQFAPEQKVYKTP